MTDNCELLPARPALLTVSFAADSVRAWGHITFMDPDHDEPRQFNVEAVADIEPARVFPAASQEHWDGSEPYLAEAERIAAAFIGATFPHLADTNGQA